MIKLHRITRRPELSDVIKCTILYHYYINNINPNSNYIFLFRLIKTKYGPRLEGLRFSKNHSVPIKVLESGWINLPLHDYTWEINYFFKKDDLSDFRYDMLESINI